METADDDQRDLRRVFRTVTLKPWHQYHLSVWIKTEQIRSPDTVRVLVRPSGGPIKDLNLTSLHVQATQDWKEHHVVFNTLDHSEVTVYVGAWEPQGGTLWFDDISLRTVAGVNMVRRDGCPIRVTTLDGSTTYEEGRDFEPWIDPGLGRVRYPGTFDIWHSEPPIILTPGSRVQDGERLKVSYYNTRVIHEGSVQCCLSHPEMDIHLERHLRFVKDLFEPRFYLMNIDEMRLAGWCGLCDDPDVTAGQLFSQRTRRCCDMIRRLDPAAEIVVWSDMFDPHHNAVDNYWQTRGTMKHSWGGLDQDITIANWNRFKARESLSFFASRGHAQIIAGYYDRSDVDAPLQEWLKSASGIKGIDGIIYTTWRNNYQDLEAFSEAIQRLHSDGYGTTSGHRRK